ncbi:hypothetical protein [Halioxenophilus sp. WMMB6]|uniref:hypothetical protein n=1 Tax=Halioxenophilus sp. WMMB6 TaxID=3073815 RepID=UPI00295E58B4|nr:hypothetical protein [Halioxenophilus sp. WMMB6]
MPQENNYNLSITAEELQTATQALQTFVNTLRPHLANLTADSRRELPKLGPRTLDFVLKAREYASLNPELAPVFLSTELFDADLAGLETLNTLQRTLQPIAEAIDDSILLAGSEAYQAALIYYRGVKTAADSNQPSAKTIRDDLSARFPNTRRANNNETGATIEEEGSTLA